MERAIDIVQDLVEATPTNLMQDRAMGCVREMARRDWDLQVLDAWAAIHPDMRRHFIHNHPAGCVELFLLNNQFQRDGRDRANMRDTRHCDWDNCWSRRFANIHATPGSAAHDARKLGAAAVWEELPQSKRAELGERP